MLTHHAADLLPCGVHRILRIVREHPLRQQCSATTHDSDQTIADQWDVRLPDTRVDREVIDALFRLMFKGLEDHRLVEILDLSTDDHRVDGHGADRDRRVSKDRHPGGIEIASGGKVHHGVCGPTFGPLEFLNFFIGRAADRRRPHVGVDLGLRGSADGHGVQIKRQVIAIRRNHQTT